VKGDPIPASDDIVRLGGRNNVFGLGVSATLHEISILAQTIWWHYAKPVLSDSSFFVGGQ
jgi:hypothetical protein